MKNFKKIIKSSKQLKHQRNNIGKSNISKKVKFSYQNIKSSCFHISLYFLKNPKICLNDLSLPAHWKSRADKFSYITKKKSEFVRKSYSRFKFQTIFFAKKVKIQILKFSPLLRCISYGEFFFIVHFFLAFTELGFFWCKLQN
jgi:hypothetical protein